MLPGPTGERDLLRRRGRGVFVCISPWNFPLAIFLGQVTAALVAGNAVIAKPAEQTPLVAFRAFQLLYKAGITPAVAQLIEGFPVQHIPRAYFAKGSYFSLRGPAPFRRLVYPLPEGGGLGIHLTLDLAGRARFGPDVEWEGLRLSGECGS